MPVNANFFEVAAESSSHQVVYMAPSVCTTPAAPSPLPLPYPLMTPNGTKGLDDDSRKVKIKNKKVFLIGSLVGSCKGNQPGTQKEIVSMTTGGSMFPLRASPNVKMDGANVVHSTCNGMGNKN